MRMLLAVNVSFYIGMLGFLHILMGFLSLTILKSHRPSLRRNDKNHSLNQADMSSCNYAMVIIVA
jgi:hypothetical protein